MHFFSPEELIYFLFCARSLLYIKNLQCHEEVSKIFLQTCSSYDPCGLQVL